MLRPDVALLAKDTVSVNGLETPVAIPTSSRSALPASIEREFHDR